MDNSLQRDILIVSATPLIREFLHEVFLTAHYRCLLAADGGEAIEKFRRSRPSLVVTDFNLPDMSGLLQDVRQDDPNAAVIILCGTVFKRGGRASDRCIPDGRCVSELGVTSLTSAPLPKWQHTGYGTSDTSCPGPGHPGIGSRRTGRCRWVLTEGRTRRKAWLCRPEGGQSCRHRIGAGPRQGGHESACGDAHHCPNREADAVALTRRKQKTKPDATEEDALCVTPNPDGRQVHSTPVLDKSGILRQHGNHRSA
jgi:CheY-like chemotaxis protein